MASPSARWESGGCARHCAIWAGVEHLFSAQLASLAIAHLQHTQWSWCRFPASSRFSFCAGACVAAFFRSGATLEGASCWGHMGAVGRRMSRGRQDGHGQQAGVDSRRMHAARPCVVAHLETSRGVGLAPGGCPGRMTATKFINTTAHKLRPLATILLPQHPNPPSALLPQFAFQGLSNVNSTPHLPSWPLHPRKTTITCAASRAQKRQEQRRSHRSASPHAHPANATAMAQSAHTEQRRQITPTSPSRRSSRRSLSLSVMAVAARHVC